MLWTMLEKMLAALTTAQIVETKRTTSESDPAQDQWAAECELGLVHLAEKAAEIANEVIVWLYEYTTFLPASALP